MAPLEAVSATTLLEDCVGGPTFEEWVKWLCEREVGTRGSQREREEVRRQAPQQGQLVKLRGDAWRVSGSGRRAVSCSRCSELEGRGEEAAWRGLTAWWRLVCAQYWLLT